MNEIYIVKKGDTLYGISNQYGVSVTELAELNNVNATTLKEGQSLKIPIKPGNNPDNLFLYTVKKGDTLYSIARRYSTSVDEIKKLNYLTSNELYINQVIRIPESYNDPSQLYIPNYINYKVLKGDTLYSIAKKYKVPIDTIIQDNALDNDNLKVGQIIRIRTVEDSIEECFGEDYIVDSNQTINYKVLKGDSLYSIAKKYNTTVDQIKKLNNLESSSISIGQVLKIPSSDILYTVVKGDNLYSIANKFNITVNKIKEKNNLTSNNLSIGQVLKI